MDSGYQNGMRNDRDAATNGINGVGKTDNGLDKGKGVMPNSAKSPMLNGASGNSTSMDADMAESQRGMEALPDEIQHITTDIMPLGLLLSRLAQISHNQLQGTIAALATKTLPQQMTNGNADYRTTTLDDSSPESLEKKTLLLDLVHDLHGKWVKALVITNWSKKAELVGKLIDIRSHLLGVLESYNANLFEIVQVKRDLHWAKVRGPDIQTALEVLSTGEANWMPDLGYIEPPPISAVEKEKWLDNLNTMLSVRLTLDEYDKIPFQFRNYRIGFGRVTFVVEGEFEVDLTIADEDFEKQFWFIDLRFLFKPAPAELSDRIRQFIELKVNDALATDGLSGCYKYLHEFVLTHKIGEFRRQAIVMSRNVWVGTLKVERLNRAMAIQYWFNKTAAVPGQRVPASWIIIGVNSGETPDQLPDVKTRSSLFLRWFRDGKEVHDSGIVLDVENISTEILLKSVIAKHVEYVFSTIYSKLLAKPRFASRQASLELIVNKSEPVESRLKMQLVDSEHVDVIIAPITGSFELSPHSAVMSRAVAKLDSSLNVAEEGAGILEQLRGLFEIQELNRLARSTGWAVSRPPIKPDELRQWLKITPQEQYQAVWLKRPAWNVNWYVLATLSLQGDRWWLVEILPGDAARATSNRLKVLARMPLENGASHMSATFLNTLTVFVAGIILHYTNSRELGLHHINYEVYEPQGVSSMPGIKLPHLGIRVLSLFKQTVNPKRVWAKDTLTLSFLGVRNVMVHVKTPRGRRGIPVCQLVAEARLTVADKTKFSLLSGQVDRDVRFNVQTGQFVMQLKVRVGHSVVQFLIARLEALQRLVYLVEAIRQGGKGVTLQSVSLRKISFSYENGGSAPGVLGLESQPAKQWTATLNFKPGGRMGVQLEKGNPHLRVKDILLKLVLDQSEQLPLWLLLTLPLFRALDKIEDDWAKINTNGQGSVEIFPRNMQWVVVRYTLPAVRRRINIDVRLRTRHGRARWQVLRSDHDPDAKNPADDTNKVLKAKIWTSHGVGWKGLMTGASADPQTGIEPLMGLLDSTIRNSLSGLAGRQQAGQ